MTAIDFKTALSEKNGGVVMALHVLPNAPKTQLIGLHNGAIKIKIKAPPVEGKANREIILFFAELLAVPRASCEILKGDKSKAKTLFISGLTLEGANSRLQQNNS